MPAPRCATTCSPRSPICRRRPRPRRRRGVWAEPIDRAVERAISVFTEIRRAATFDLTTLSVALRQLRNLVLSTAPY